mmetsp:Transcript_41566/g.109472  ORF Transcript_41566/g.109472 Transcript_41566/m.109472 type:complete len:265 (-) Transcript_41566:1728-2522(-)
MNFTSSFPFFFFPPPGWSTATAYRPERSSKPCTHPVRPLSSTALLRPWRRTRVPTGIRLSAAAKAVSICWTHKVNPSSTSSGIAAPGAASSPITTSSATIPASVIRARPSPPRATIWDLSCSNALSRCWNREMPECSCKTSTPSFPANVWHASQASHSLSLTGSSCPSNRSASSSMCCLSATDRSFVAFSRMITAPHRAACHMNRATTSATSAPTNSLRPTVWQAAWSTTSSVDRSANSRQPHSKASSHHGSSGLSRPTTMASL